MNRNNLKKIITVLSLFGLIINSTPLFAQTIELEILGGGYKIKGPTNLTFAKVNSSTSNTTSEIPFEQINTIDPQEKNNFIMITDENGGNPFDVTVTATQLKREETFSSVVTTGSSGNNIKVRNNSGLNIGDNLEISDITPNFFTVISLPDSSTIVVNPTPTQLPSGGNTIQSVINCDRTPQKCIPLNNLEIMSSETYDTINGDTDGISTTDYSTYKSIGAETKTITGSENTTLKVIDSSSFQANESILILDTLGNIINTNTIDAIIDTNTITIHTAFTAGNAPQSGSRVRSTNTRSISLAKGKGTAPGQWKIYPTIKGTVNAGQRPGKYIGVLNFTII